MEFRKRESEKKIKTAYDNRVDYWKEQGEANPTEKVNSEIRELFIPLKTIPRLDKVKAMAELRGVTNEDEKNLLRKYTQWLPVKEQKALLILFRELKAIYGHEAINYILNDETPLGKNDFKDWTKKIGLKRTKI